VRIDICEVEKKGKRGELRNRVSRFAKKKKKRERKRCDARNRRNLSKKKERSSGLASQAFWKKKGEDGALRLALSEKKGAHADLNANGEPEKKNFPYFNPDEENRFLTK